MARAASNKTVNERELIPDSERWLHEPEVKAELDEALAWAAEHRPQETDLDELEERLLGERPAKTRSSRSQ